MSSFDAEDGHEQPPNNQRSASLTLPWMFNRVYTNYSPEFQIDSISVSPPNISNSQISTNWTMGIMVTNPNKRSHIVYDGLEVSLFYEADQNLCSTRIAPLRQGPKNTTTLAAESQACLQDLNDHLFAGVTESAARAISKDLRGGIGDFNVKLRVRHRHVNPLWPGKNWIHKDFDCLNIKVLFASDGTSSKILGCKNCF
ncbi:NDR1/HIN1-like protein 10 [Coffea arabica]|uniref:NDR1/HIN1-like protein 10 n=1 Tax=Coffea arabica TaxID=13443 RepID=A0A6P6XEI4_COFAR|nr:uncharacterized protein LOC113742480 [Coffea arabica]